MHNTPHRAATSHLSAGAEVDQQWCCHQWSRDCGISVSVLGLLCSCAVIVAQAQIFVSCSSTDGPQSCMKTNRHVRGAGGGECAAVTPCCKAEPSMRLTGLPSLFADHPVTGKLHCRTQRNSW